MGLQTVVRDDIAVGVVGDIIIDGNRYGSSSSLNSTNEYNNVIGRAVRHLSGNDKEVSADATAGSAFAGILANSKAYASISGRLDPSMTLPNGTAVELLHGVSGMVVELSTSANIGDNLFYATSTGILAASDGQTLSGHERIFGGSVIRHNIGGDSNLAIIQIVPAQEQSATAPPESATASHKKPTSGK